MTDLFLSQIFIRCSNLATKTVENMTLNKRLRLYWDEENNLIQVYVDSTYKGNLKFTP